MANCELCGKNNISFMGGYSISGITGKICEDCRSHLLKLRSSNDEDSKHYFQAILQSTSSDNIAHFILNELKNHTSSDSISDSEITENINRIKSEIDSILLSTTDSIINHKIEASDKIVTGISVLGTGFFSELNAGISDMLGVNSSSFENKISEAKDNALYMLKKEAHKIQCNAVIGTSITFVPLSGNMIGILATGTAVKVS